MRRALGVLLFVAVLVGTALALNNGVGLPELPNLPSSAQLTGTLSSSYLSLDTIIAVFGFVGWLIWVYVLSVTLLRLIAWIATRLALPGATGLVRLSDRVTPFVLRRILDLALGGALLVSTVSGPPVAAATATLSPPAALESIDLASNGHRRSASAETQTLRDQEKTYTVRPGDSLWRIAERELGSGIRWNEIYELNAGRVQDDGRKLKEPRLIRPGWQLLLPHIAQDCEPVPEKPAPLQSLDPPPASSPVPPATPSDKSPAPNVTVERPIKVELPNGAVIPASFAAGALAGSLLERLRRRRQRRIGDDEPPPLIDPVALAASRVGIDPSLDVIGRKAEAVINVWRGTYGQVPTFLAAWEEAKVTTFLISSSPKELPDRVETTPGQQIAFERVGEVVRARVSGAQVPRLRRSPYAGADGVLLPVGFSGDGVLHIPLLGVPLQISGPAAAEFVGTFLKCLDMRIGDDRLEVWANEDHTSEADLRGKLEMEALQRRRLFREEGSLTFTDHVLDHPDDQLPIIVVVVNAEIAGAITDVVQLTVQLGIAVIIEGEEETGARRILCDDDRSHVYLKGHEPISVEPVRLPQGIAASTTESVRVEPESTEPPLQESTVGSRSPDARLVGSEDTATSVDEEASRRIYCLGGFRIELDGGVLDTGWRSAALEILAALIAYPNGLSRDQLVSLIWPDSEFSEVERIFHVSVSQIRSNLRRSEDTSKIIVSSRIEETYRLDLSQVWVDVAAFRAALKNVETSQDPEPFLRKVLDLYKGDFLGEKYYPWAEQIRESLRDSYDDAAARLAVLLEKRGDLYQALQLIDQALEHNPLSEDLCRRAMRLEAAIGNRQGVIDRFQRLKTELARELELEPSEEAYEMFSSLVRRPENARRS